MLEIQKAAISATMPEAPRPQTGKLDVSAGSKSTAGPEWRSEQTKLQEELKEAGDEVTKALRDQQREMIDALDLSKYVHHSILPVLSTLGPTNPEPSTLDSLSIMSLRIGPWLKRKWRN